VAPQQRLFFTLEAMGLLEQYHDKVFAAMHVDRLRLNSDEQVFDWAARNGVERGKFIDTYRSFGIQQRLRRADAMMDAYRVDRWPVVVIDGRFLTSPSHANEQSSEARTEAQRQQIALQVMDSLVDRAKAEKADKDKAR
jgi:thiol:disulfide interchange protein DsbA